MGTNNVNLHLFDEVHRLQQKNEQLAKENECLKSEQQASNAITFEMFQTNSRLQQELMQNNEEKKRLFQRIESLQRRVCSEDCLCCTIVHICENNELGLGKKICCPQLRTIFLYFAFCERLKIAPEDIKCAQFMEILKKCKVVEISPDDIYEYLQHTDGRMRQNEMSKAFDKLMTINPRSPVVIIGRLKSKSTRKGHAELCFLNSRTQDGKVTIHDPQDNTAIEGGREDFVNHVKNDEVVEFYTVNLDILKQIINYFAPILHLDTPPGNTLDVLTMNSL